MERYSIKSIFFSLIPYFSIFILLLPTLCFAHENWILTPAEVMEWNAKPLPELFTTLNATNVSLVLVTILFLIGWISLGFTGARELFPDLQIRLASYGDLAAFILRISLGLTLFMSAVGAIPRFGVPYFTSPTLISPDLQLSLLTGNWLWLAWVEAIVAILLIVGIYTRLAAFLTAILTGFCFYLFGYLMLDYAGYIFGIAIYLLLQGSGSFFVPMPEIPYTQKLVAWLQSQPRARAQFLLRMFVGISFMYLGIKFKILQPNLVLAILLIYDVPTFGISPETLVFIMALVETLAGALLIAGVLLRPMSIFLLFCFLFFMVMLREPPFSHLFANGVLLTFLLNGGGQWRRPIAKDKAAHIVILGGSFAGIHGAIKLSRLLGDVTNVKVTLIHQENYFQFDPLLPEVVGGAIQPGNIVNPIRRILPHVHFVQAKVNKIFHQEQCVELTTLSDNVEKIYYDELIIALGVEVDFHASPGVLEHALPMMTIGDALLLRQKIIECLEQADTCTNAIEREGLLTFAVIGGGLRGTSIAAEIQTLLNSALPSYSSIKPHEIRVLLFEKEMKILPQFNQSLSEMASVRLRKLTIQVNTATEIAAITPTSIILASGKKFFCQTIVYAVSTRASLLKSLPGVQPNGRIAVDPFFQARAINHVFVVGDGADFMDKYPFLAWQQVHMGHRAAYNAWAKTQGYALRAWSAKQPFIYIAALGRKASVGRLFHTVPISGLSAWFVSRLICLLTMPGLERNLRIFIDWLLDIPFRTDITILTPKPTVKFASAHYEAGDIIISEGEKGTCAYILASGRVEVLKTIGGETKQVAILETGECFGEIALLTGAPRTATIRCLTPANIIILSRDQLLPLLHGFRELGNILYAKMGTRM